MKKKDFFFELKNKCPDDNEKKQTKEFIEVFENKKGEKLSKLYLKSDVILLPDAFIELFEVSTKEYGINLLYCVFLPGYTYQSAMKNNVNKLQTLQDKDLILFLFESFLRGGVSSIMGDR